MFGYCPKCNEGEGGLWIILDTKRIPHWRSHTETSHEKPLDLTCHKCDKVFPRLRDLTSHACEQLSGVEDAVVYELLGENDPLAKRLRGLPMSTVHEICVSFCLLIRMLKGHFIL